MKGPLLSLDCSGGACSVAIIDSGNPLAAPLALRQELLDRGHAERLMPMIAEALDEAEVTASDLAGIAPTVGPGAFTGVRVGLAAAQGLAKAGQVPVIGVSTTDALACSVPVGADHVLAVAIDSRRADPFIELYDPGTDHWIGRGPFILSQEGALDGIPPTLLVGSAAALVQQHFPKSELLSSLVHPDPVAQARLAVSAVQRGTAKPAVPLYLRAPDVSPPSRDKSRRSPLQVS